MLKILVVGLAVGAATACAPASSPGTSPDDGEGGQAGALTAGKGGNRAGTSGSQAGASAGASGSSAANDGGARDGAAPAQADAPPPSTEAAKVVISEIMYHPTGETTADELREFVEVANASDKMVDLGGWKLTNEVEFTFPAGTKLAPGQHLAVAMNPTMLSATWGLAAGAVLGPFMGELDNGGGTLSLMDAVGGLVDRVKYDDGAPWPVGADAFGAGVAWLPAALDPAKHVGKGHSLERIALDADSNDPANWTTSPLDGATPSAKNAAAGKTAAVVLSAVAVAKSDDKKVVFSDKDAILVRFAFSKLGTVTKPAIEYFVDDVEATGEATKVVEATATAAGWDAEIPALPANSIVRYRVQGDRGGGTRVTIGPRETDPNKWYAYFVSPTVSGKTPTQHLFIKRADWTQLYKNIENGRGVPKMLNPFPGTWTCNLSPTWELKVPAVLVVDNHVVDIQARYQGSPFNRMNGVEIGAVPGGKGPTAPSPMKALSWHFSLPRYAPVNDRRDIILNKRQNECSFLTTSVGGKIFESAGIPSSLVKMARLYVNGTYLHMFTDVEAPDEAMIERSVKQATGVKPKVGDLFKVVGYIGDQGPYTWADGREFKPLTTCPQFTPAQLYDYNFERKYPDYEVGSGIVMKLITDMHAARRADGANAAYPATRKFFADNFDLERLTSYIAIINWLGPWDDFFQNHFFYRRKEDGKWMLLPWDFDRMFGDVDLAEGKPLGGSSFYYGEIGDRSNRTDFGSTWKSDFKDSFIKAYRTELHTKLQALVKKELLPETVDAYLNEILGQYTLSEAQAAHSKSGCGFVNDLAKRIRDFTRARNARVTSSQFK